MQQRLILINILLPLAVLSLPYFVGELVFKIPEYLKYLSISCWY